MVGGEKSNQLSERLGSARKSMGAFLRADVAQLCCTS